jgi:flagellar biosynthesis regulator FlaF
MSPTDLQELDAVAASADRARLALARALALVAAYHADPSDVASAIAEALNCDDAMAGPVADALTTAARSAPAE